MQVCPTGIDIRDGLQYECINCGACVDACDQTMERMGYPKGLISYTTEHKLANDSTRGAAQADWLRPGDGGDAGVFVYNAMSIMPMGLDILRDRNQLFRENSEGSSRTPTPSRSSTRPCIPRPISWMWRGCRSTNGSARAR